MKNYNLEKYYQPMIDKKYGRWTVINISGNKLLCKCECGKIKEVSRNSLINGHSKSCGCYHSEVMALKLHKHKVDAFLSKDVLKQEYIENHKTDKQIGDKYGFHKETIRRYRKRLNIDFLKISSLNEKELSEEQKEIIMGCILGDGHITHEGTMEIVHSKKQYSYIYWLWAKLKSIVSDAGLQRLSKDKYRFRLKSLDFLKRLRQQLYPNGIKIVPREFLDELTPLSLSVWFSDDAFLDNGSNYVICTQGFSCEDRQVICDYFKEKWNINSTIKKAYNKKYDKYYEMTLFDHFNSTKLTNIIKYHLIPSLLYKVIKSERKHIVYLAGGMQKAPDGGIKWRRNIKQKLNEKGYYCIDPTKEEDCLLLENGWRDCIESDFHKFQKGMRKIIENDLYFVEMSGSIVCLYDDFLGGGSFHEIGESYLSRKKLYLVNLHNLPIQKMNWWSLGCCTKVVHSFEELITEFPDISNEDYVPYKTNKLYQTFKDSQKTNTI